MRSARRMLHDTRTNRRRFGGLIGSLLGLAGAVAASKSAAQPASKPQAGNGPPADDRLAIIELTAIYAWAYDTGDAKALAATFTADGVLEVFGTKRVTGEEGFAAMIEEAATMRGAHGWQHLSDHHVFRDYDGQSCTLYSYYTMPESDPNGGNVTLRAMGYYVSHCVRTTAGWRFAKRTVTRWNGKAPMAL